MSIVGDTGSGKSTLASQLLLQRKYVLILRTKPDDVSYDAKRTTKAKTLLDAKQNRIELYPESRLSQAREFAKAFEIVGNQGGWTVYIDELFYVDQKLGLAEYVDEHLTQGRSRGITVVSGMQRPVQVTRFAMGESIHLLSFSLEGRDVKILREVAPLLSQQVDTLERYQFAWYERRSKDIWIGRLQDLQTT